MASTIYIIANWNTGALSQQTISRQYDNNRYTVQFVGYPESEDEALDYYLLVWMSSSPGQKPDEIAPILLNSDQWHISNVFTQQVQIIKFQMCVLNGDGTYEAHSPIFTGRIGSSLEHDGTSQDIDVSTLFDAYREYIEDLIIGAGAVIIDPVPTQGSNNAVSSGGVWDALQAKGDVKTINGMEPDASGNIEIEAGGGLSDNAVELLVEILNEGLFGTNQADNIIALNAELRGNVLSSISAVLNGIPLIGMTFNDLDFTVTATYSDGTTAEVSSFAVSDGTVVSGSNTATITYRGKTTTVTFEASYVTAYTITYNLTDVTSSNMTTVTAGESSYTTTLSIASGYSFGSCTVTMGGVDVTNDVYSNMEILIQSVTGDVVITANAVQETILDPLIRINKNVEGVVFAYSDDYQTQATRINNSAVPLVTEYPALNACTLKWTLTNTSDGAVSISAVGMGCVPAYDSSWRTDSYFRVAYWQAITIQGGSLGAGESLEGYYTLPAGYQFVFINNSVGKDVLTLSLAGGYVADTFAGYKKITSTGYSTTYGSYRSFTWYRDNGVTELLTANSQRYVLFDDTLDAGTYDVVYRIKGDVIALSATTDKVVVGAVMSNTDTSANNSFGYPGNIHFNVWLKGTLGISDNGMTLLGREGQINGEIIEMYCKEVA